MDKEVINDLVNDHNGKKFRDNLKKIEKLTELGELHDDTILLLIRRLIKNDQFFEDISSEILQKIDTKISTQYDLGLALNSIGLTTLDMIPIIEIRLPAIKEKKQLAIQKEQLAIQKTYHYNLVSSLRNGLRIEMDDKQRRRLYASYIEIEQQSRSELEILKKNFEKEQKNIENKLKYQEFLQYLQEDYQKKVRMLQKLVENNNKMESLMRQYLKKKIKLPTTEALSNLSGNFMSLIEKLNNLTP